MSPRQHGCGPIWGLRTSPVHNRAMLTFRFLVLCALTAGLAACSPAQEWRSVKFEALGLQANLPCKPDRAERKVEMAGAELPVIMQGCDAGGTTYALACAPLAQPERAGLTLTHWRAAVLAAAQARELHEKPFLPAGALGLPQSLRTTGTGVMPGGGPMHLEAAWFSRLQGKAVLVCHAIAYGPELTPAVADVFFNGLTLQ